MAVGRSQEEAQREGASKQATASQRPLQAVAEGIGSVAEGIRERAPQAGRAGKVAERLAQTLETGSKYLSEHDVPELAEDVTQLVKRYPLQTMWVGLGLGFVLGRLVTTRRRYS